MKKALHFPRNFWITAGMSAFAALLAIVFPSKHRLLAFFAMVLSSLGDLALMNFMGIFRKIRLNGFITGGVLFLLSHLTYAAAFSCLMAENGLRIGGIGAGMALVMLLLTFISLTALSIRRNRFGWLKTLLFACYLTAITVHCVCNFSCSVGLTQLSPANAWRLTGAVGAVLFWLSDYFIGLDKVAGIPDYGRYIWRFYTAGQILILIAA